MIDGRDGLGMAADIIEKLLPDLLAAGVRSDNQTQGARQRFHLALADPAPHPFPDPRQVASELFDSIQQVPAVELNDIPGKT